MCIACVYSALVQYNGRHCVHVYSALVQYNGIVYVTGTAGTLWYCGLTLVDQSQEPVAEPYAAVKELLAPGVASVRGSGGAS